MSNKYCNKLPLSYEICGIKLNIFEPGWQLRQGETDRQSGPHSHFTFEAFFTVEGTLALVTDRNTEIYERKIVIVPPKCRHYSVCRGEWGLCLLFAFDRQQAENDTRVRLIQDILNRGIYACDLDDGTAFYIRKAAQALESETPASGKEAEFLIGLLFCGLICRLLPDTRTEGTSKNKTKHINAIESFINANIYQPITPADVAKNVYLSVRQVSRIVAKEYQCTLRQFILERKLDAAEALIKNTDTKVAQVAAMLQLGSENYFYTLFKKRYGRTPLQYRKAAKRT